MEITSGGTPGPALDEALADLGNNVYGTVVDAPDLEAVAQGFVRSGCRAHRSSWTEYQVGCSWVEIELYRHDGVTGFAGVADPERAGSLVEVFAGLGYSCSVELYDEGGELIAEF